MSDRTIDDPFPSMFAPPPQRRVGADGRCMACGRVFESTAGDCPCVHWRRQQEAAAEYHRQVTDPRSPHELVVELLERWRWLQRCEPAGPALSNAQLADEILRALGLHDSQAVTITVTSTGADLALARELEL